MLNWNKFASESILSFLWIFFWHAVKMQSDLKKRREVRRRGCIKLWMRQNHLGRNSTVRGRSTVRQTKTTTEKKKRWSTCIFCVNLSCFIYFCICCDVMMNKEDSSLSEVLTSILAVDSHGIWLSNLLHKFDTQFLFSLVWSYWSGDLSLHCSKSKMLDLHI